MLGTIGKGGMGVVYRALDTRLDREVAVKVLPASFSNDADRLRRFEQEARAAGLLNHPNITAVYDIGSYDEAPYIVTELLEGETLRTELAGGRFSTRKVIDYAVQITHGLAAVGYAGPAVATGLFTNPVNTTNLTSKHRQHHQYRQLWPHHHLPGEEDRRRPGSGAGRGRSWPRPWRRSAAG